MKTTKTVRDVLRNKGGQVWSVAPNSTVYDALKLMSDHNIGAVLVVENDTPLGLFSEREYARQVILKGKSSRETPVREIMIPKLCCVDPDQNIEECMALMTDKRVRHLPVIENDRLVGILSIGDVVKTMIEDKEFVIEQLARYIKQGG